MRSHCAIVTAFVNGLYRTQWKCSHYAFVTTSPAPMQFILSKNKLQPQSEIIAQCERTFKPRVRMSLNVRVSDVGSVVGVGVVRRITHSVPDHVPILLSVT